MAKPHIVIISPYLANANNGNWQTAWRWSRFLKKSYRVSLASEWDGGEYDVMIALHARRSATSIAAFAAASPAQPLIVVLTGTDLYRDIMADESAKFSLQVATQLIVLQTAGLQMLDERSRSKARAIFQSAPTLKSLTQNMVKVTRYFDVIMIGHMRDEKDPSTYMHAVEFLKSPRIRVIHIGNALDPVLGGLAEKIQLQFPRYQWLGNVEHAATRQRLKRSQLMVITSKMEGGANVIIEAITSGVPVLASDISGNRGMLGENYGGYFPVGDSIKLAELINQAESDRTFYRHLYQQCAARAELFLPEREKTALIDLVGSCITDK